MLGYILGSSITLILYIVCLTLSSFEKLDISKELEEKFDKVRISISSFFDKMSNISIRLIIDRLKLYSLIISTLLFAISFIYKNDISMIVFVLFLWLFASLNSFGNNFYELKSIILEAFKETKGVSNKLLLFAFGLFIILIFGITNIPEIGTLKIESLILLFGICIIVLVISVLIGIFLFHLSFGLIMALPAILIFLVLLSMINLSRFLNLLDYSKYRNFCIIFMVIMGSLFAYNQFLIHQ